MQKRERERRKRKLDGRRSRKSGRRTERKKKAAREKNNKLMKAKVMLNSDWTISDGQTLRMPFAPKKAFAAYHSQREVSRPVERLFPRSHYWCSLGPCFAFSSADRCICIKSKILSLFAERREKSPNLKLLFGAIERHSANSIMGKLREDLRMLCIQAKKHARSCNFLCYRKRAVVKQPPVTYLPNRGQK